MSNDTELFSELREYFEQRADAEYFSDRPAPVPNEEMKLLEIVSKLENSFLTARLNEEVWEQSMMEVIGEDGPASVADAIRSLQAQAARAQGEPVGKAWYSGLSSKTQAFFEINEVPPGTLLYTYQPSGANQGGVPEGYAKEKLTGALRQYRHNNDNTGPSDKPENGFIFGYDKQAVDDLFALLTTSPNKPERVRCDERLPTLRDADCEGCVWFWSKNFPMSRVKWQTVRDWGMRPSTPDEFWAPTGLKRPQPPQEQREGE